MKNLSFEQFLSTNTDINAEILEKLVPHCQRKVIEKDTFLLREGEFSTHYYYVESGLLRQYSIDNKGKEHTLQFAPEGWFIGDRESLTQNLPSKCFIQALEKSQVLEIDDKLLLKLAKENESFLEFNNRLFNNHINSLQKRINQLLSASAEERYLDFIKIYPDILLRVPQTLVASYLGITPESLSRIRKELATKNQS